MLVVRLLKRRTINRQGFCGKAASCHHRVFVRMVEIPTTPQKRVPRSRWDVFEKSMRGMTMEEEGQKGRKNGNVRRHSTAKHKDIPIPSPSARYVGDGPFEDRADPKITASSSFPHRTGSSSFIVSTPLPLSPLHTFSQGATCLRRMETSPQTPIRSATRIAPHTVAPPYENASKRAAFCSLDPKFHTLLTPQKPLWWN